MKFLDRFKIRLVLVGFAAILLGGGSAIADFTFGTPTTLWPTLNSPYMDGSPIVAANGLSLIFASDLPNGDGECNLWVTTRATVEDDWGALVSLANVNSSADEAGPSLSADGRSLFFSSFVGTPRPGGHGKCDIWVTTRATASDPWGPPVNLDPPVNTLNNDFGPFIWGDGCTLLFSSDRDGGSGSYDLWMTTRETTDNEWATPVPLENVNSGGPELLPAMSPDGRILFFQRGYGGTTDLWMATRKSIDEPFGPPERVPSPINYLDYDDCNARFAPDGSTLYITSNRSEGGLDYDWWQVPILPTVDFNGDGKVDRLDVGFVLLYWGTDDSLCDIGPTPFGDGIVDSKDLMVLAEYGAILAGDVNYDGVVDFLDLAELAKNWLRQQP